MMLVAGRAVGRPALVALLVGLAVFAVLFHQEIGAAVQVWLASTAFSHCFVVLPLAAYLAWDRRHLAAGHRVRPIPWVAVAAIPLGVVWFAADRIGVMEGRQLVAICFVELLFLATLGWRLFAAFSAALLYLFFLVPFGAFIVPTLQAFTTDFITTGLGLLGIPYYADSFTIEIGAGTFLVAEACAGLRFLIASVAFGVLYACLLYRSPLRRVVFIAASIVVPIIANGFRGLGIVVLGDVLGSAQAAAVDHIVYGWLFFSAVLLVMILVGLPFREDARPRVAAPPPALSSALSPAVPIKGGTGRPMLAVLAVIVPMAVGPAVAALLDRSAAAERIATAMPSFAPVAGCVAAPGPPAAVLDPDHPAVQLFTCQGIRLAAMVEIFAPRTDPSRLIAAVHQATDAGDAEDAETSTLVLDTGEPSRWGLVATGDGVRLTATSLWIGGAPALGGLRSRLRQGWSSIAGARHAPMLVAVTVEADDRASSGRARLLLRSFLQAQDTLGVQIARLSALPASSVQ